LNRWSSSTRPSAAPISAYVQLSDPHHLFNSGLDAKTPRAIDLKKGDAVNEAALNELVRAAVARNGGKR